MTEEGTSRSVHRFTEKELSQLTRIDNIIQPYESVNTKKCMPEFLWWLCRLGKNVLCSQFLEKYLKETFNHGRMAGKTCFHMAVYWYHNHLIPLLHKHKFEINRGDDRSLRPLFWAVFYDNDSLKEKAIECADILRRYGAKVERTTAFAETNEWVSELIRDPNKTRLKLFSNSCDDIYDALRLLRKENDKTGNWEEDIKFWINFWLWKFSATHDQVPLCIYLIREGARPTEVFYITSAFHRAARFGNTELLCYLLDPNMKKRWPEVVHTVDKLGWTALHNASLNNQEDCVLLLLQHGADWRKTTREGTALDIAKKYHSQRVVKLLQDQYQRNDYDDDAERFDSAAEASTISEDGDRLRAENCEIAFLGQNVSITGLSLVQSSRQLNVVHARKLAVLAENVSISQGEPAALEDIFPRVTVNSGNSRSLQFTAKQCETVYQSQNMQINFQGNSVVSTFYTEAD